MTCLYETNEVVYYFTISVNTNLCDKCIAFPLDTTLCFDKLTGFNVKQQQ